MNQNNRRIFNDNGTQYRFNNKAFQSCITAEAKSRRIPQEKLIKGLAEAIDVTIESVKNWRYDRTGVSDMERIKKIADYLHVDPSLLVIKEDGGNDMIQLTERQKDAAKRIYDVLIWFLDEFYNSDGFNSWWIAFKEQGINDPEDAIFERITQMGEKVQLVLNQEYFDLHDQDIYDDFCEFANEDLIHVYDGKLRYAYRFEADGINASTAWQDYEKAMIRLNKIIERII